MHGARVQIHEGDTHDQRFRRHAEVRQRGTSTSPSRRSACSRRAFRRSPTEVADYSKKAVEAGSAQFEKLLGVKTLDKAIELQAEFAKASYEGYVAHATKVGELVTELAKEATKPLETIFAKAGK